MAVLGILIAAGFLLFGFLRVAFSGKQVPDLPSLLDKAWIICRRNPAINASALLSQHKAL